MKISTFDRHATRSRPRVSDEARVRQRPERRARTEDPARSQDALARVLEGMLQKLTEMLSRVQGAGQANGAATASGTREGGMPELNPSAGSRSTYGGAPVFTGFDAQKLAAPLKLGADGQPSSAKYTFAKLAQESGTMPRTKEEAERWFNEHIKPGMEAAGFQVDWVKGDKAMIRTRENPQGEVVDFVRGAGSNDPNYTALAWQSEGPVGGASGTGAAGSGRVDRDFVLSILSKYPPTNEGIEQALEELRRQPGYENARILQHPQRLDKIDFGGQVVDVIAGAGGPNPSWGWMPE